MAGRSREKPTIWNPKTVQPKFGRQLCSALCSTLATTPYSLARSSSTITPVMNSMISLVDIPPAHRALHAAPSISLSLSRSLSLSLSLLRPPPPPPTIYLSLTTHSRSIDRAWKPQPSSRTISAAWLSDFPPRESLIKHLNLQAFLFCVEEGQRQPHPSHLSLASDRLRSSLPRPCARAIPRSWMVTTHILCPSQP